MLPALVVLEAVLMYLQQRELHGVTVVAMGEEAAGLAIMMQG